MIYVKSLKIARLLFLRAVNLNWDDRWIKAKEDNIAVLCELKYTAEVLTKDRENKYAWLQRQRILKSMGGWRKEILFCDKHIMADPTNKAAWDQRFFVFKEHEMCWLSEVKQAIRYILVDPTVENPWLYLKSIYHVIKDDSKFIKDDSKLQRKIRDKLDQFFYKVLPPESFDSWFPLPDNFTVIHRVNEVKHRLALATLLELACDGYDPNKDVKAVVLLFDPQAADHSLYFEIARDVLILLCPLNQSYWRWLASEVEKLEYARLEKEISVNFDILSF